MKGFCRYKIMTAQVFFTITAMVFLWSDLVAANGSETTYPTMHAAISSEASSEKAPWVFAYSPAL